MRVPVVPEIGPRGYSPTPPLPRPVLYLFLYTTDVGHFQVICHRGLERCQLCWDSWVAGIAQWLERRTRDWKVAGSSPGRRENSLLQGQVYMLTLILVSVRPPVTAVARSRSFCQKCRWQVTAKHACTCRMWLCMKWHGAWLYGVHSTRRDGSSFMWHQLCERCKYTISVDIEKGGTRNAIHWCRITCQRSASARERKIAFCKRTVSPPMAAAFWIFKHLFHIYIYIYTALIFFKFFFFFFFVQVWIMHAVFATVCVCVCVCVWLELSYCW